MQNEIKKDRIDKNIQAEEQQQLKQQTSLFHHPNNHQLAVIQPSFNSISKQSIVSLIKHKRNALSSIPTNNNKNKNYNELPKNTTPSPSRQHARLISPMTTINLASSSAPNHHVTDPISKHSSCLSQFPLSNNNPDHCTSQSTLSTRIPPSYINLMSNSLDISDPNLSQVVMTPTTEEWWSFAGISHKPPKNKSSLYDLSTSAQLQAQLEEQNQEDQEEDEEEDQVEDQSDHTGSSSFGSYQCTQAEPSSSTTTTPDSTLEALNNHNKIHTLPSTPVSTSDSPLDFSTGLISDEPEPTQALPTLTSVNGIINIPFRATDQSSSNLIEPPVSFPRLTAMSSNSFGQASQDQSPPLTSTALLSSLLDKAHSSTALRPCSLNHDGIVRKSIDPRSYSAMTGHRNLDSFVIQSSAGSGAYGIVKHAREKGPDGQPIGPPLMIKYIIKQRILADCWKRHKVLGPIPVEIHVLDHLRRVNSRPSMFTMAKKFIQNSNFHHESKCPRTIPNRVELVEYFTQKEELAHTYDESDVQQRTAHPNICGILDYFEDSDYYYLVMPRFGEGKDLFEHIETAPDGLPPDEVRSIFGQIVDAVAYLHERNIVHRDLKDENVVLDGNGNVQLIDFGSASYIREGSKFETFSGTLDFAAPEVLKGIPHGGKEIDIWALGVILYVLITGECPFWNPEEAVKGIGSGTRSRARLEEHLFKNSNGSSNSGQVGDSEAILDLLEHCLNLDCDQRPSVEIICWHKFFLSEPGWIGPQIPQIGSIKTCSTSSSSDVDPPPSAITNTP